MKSEFNDKIQCDRKLRAVALPNLEAMCDRISGVCHQFNVVKATANRVTVEYSNPDEYGTFHPMQAVFPAYTQMGNALMVCLTILNVYHDNWHGEGWQAFDQLLDCPELFRRNPDTSEWKSREEWEASETRRLESIA